MTKNKPADEQLAIARNTMPSGHYLPIRARGGATRVLVVAVEHDAQQLEPLADELSWLQIDRPFVKPILLLNTPHVGAVRRRGFVYETAVDAATWPTYDPAEGSYNSYLDRRVFEMIKIYGPHHTVVAEPGRPLPRWPFTK